MCPVSSADKSPAESSHQAAGHEHQLLRALGLGVAISVVVGNVIGAGIFAKPSRIATEAGAFPIIISGWILGGVICIFGALCFAELSAMLPRAGGIYVFLREAYGRRVAFLFGLNEYVFGRTATNAALSVYFSSLCCAPFFKTDSAPDPWFKAAIACAAIVGLTAINVVGVIWGGRVQGLTTLIKAGFLALIAIVPFLFMAVDSHGVQAANYWTTITPRQPTFSTQFAAILLAVMWAYNGWHDIAPVAEEVRDPQRNIPRSLIFGTLSLMLLYVGANLAYHGTLTMEEISRAGGNTAQLTIQRALQPLGANVAVMGANAITLVTICSVFGALNCNLMLGPRVAFAMARDGIFWRPLAHVHPRFHTPFYSILAQAGMSCGLVIIGTYLLVHIDSLITVIRQTDVFELFKRMSNDDLRNLDLFTVFTDFVVYSANVFYALCVLAVYVLRYKHPEWERPYRTWGYPFVPAFYLLAMGWFLWVTFWAAPQASLVAVILMLLGVPTYSLITWNTRGKTD